MKKTKPLGRQKFDAFTLEPIGEQSRSKYLARSGLIKNPTAVGEIYETTSRVASRMDGHPAALNPWCITVQN